jgi:hypothetical protein
VAPSASECRLLHTELAAMHGPGPKQTLLRVSERSGGIVDEARSYSVSANDPIAEVAGLRASA